MSKSKRNVKDKKLQAMVLKLTRAEQEDLITSLQARMVMHDAAMQEDMGSQDKEATTASEDETERGEDGPEEEMVQEEGDDEMEDKQRAAKRQKTRPANVSPLTELKYQPAALLHQLKPPRLTSAQNDAVLQFELGFKVYEQEVAELVSQGHAARATAVSLCVAPHILRYIKQIKMKLSPDEVLSEKALREFLFERTESTMSMEEKKLLIIKVGLQLKMYLGRGGSVVEAAGRLFEKWFEISNDSKVLKVITEKKTIQMLSEALKPASLKAAVKSAMQSMQDWTEAKNDIIRFEELVMQEAKTQDALNERALLEKALDGIPRSGGGEPRPLVCYRCKQTGHKQQDCTQTRTGEGGAGFGVNGRSVGGRGNGGRGGGSFDRGRGRGGFGGADRGRGRGGGGFDRGRGRGGLGGFRGRGRGGAVTGGSGRKCFKCGEAGHMIADCPSVGRPTPMDEQRGARSFGKKAPDTLLINGEVAVPYLFDTGCDSAVITRHWLKECAKQGMPLHLKPHPSGVVCVAANGDKLSSPGYVEIGITLTTVVGSTRMERIQFDVVEGGPEPMLLGDVVMSSLGFTPMQRQLEIKHTEEAILRSARSVRRCAEEYEDSAAAETAFESESRLIDEIAFPHVEPEESARRPVGYDPGSEYARVLLEQVAANSAPKLMESAIRGRLRGEWGNSFRTTLGHDPPARVPPLQVHLIKNVRLPTGYGARRYSPEHIEAIEGEISGLMEVGVIYASAGPVVVSCVHMVRKPGGRGWRMTVDYRGINAITEPEEWPFPRLDDILQRVKGAKVFGTLDLLKGFWQFPLHEDAQGLYAFKTHDSVYAWNRVPMGARNAATHFQRVMVDIMRRAGLLNRGVLVYMDDILVYANSTEELLALWDRVFAALGEVGIFANPSKCVLYAERIVWCGHLLSGRGVEVDPVRLAALEAIPEPVNAQQLNQFLMSVNWIRDKVPRYAEFIAPLQAIYNSCMEGKKRRTGAVAAGVSVASHGWGAPQVEAFAALKAAIRDAVCLAHPRESWEMHMFPDASDKHWGVMLTQTPPGAGVSGKPVEDWGHEPLAFLSGTFKGAQEGWATVDKEAFAFREGCERLEHFLHRRGGFEVHTDHRNLLYIFDPAGRSGAGLKKATVGRLDRWAMLLREFNYTVRHIVGETNNWADMLSRWGATGAAAAEEREVNMRAVRVVIPNRLAAVILDDDWDPEAAAAAPAEAEWPTAAALLEGQRAARAANAEAGGAQLVQGEDGLLRNASGKVWVPSPAEGGGSLRMRLMVIAHAGAAGHRGGQVTMDALAERYWWDTVLDDVKTFQLTCLQCVKIAGGASIARPQGEQLVATRPGQILHFDFLYVGKGEGGFVYLLVLKDGFSGYVSLVPCMAATAAVAASAILDWCSRLVIPTVLYSDQGPHFKNRLLDKVRRQLKTQHHFVTPLSPWANGGVERVNREVLRVVRALLSENQMGEDQWPYLMPAVQAALNQAPSARCGGSAPVTAMTGLEPAHVLDTVMPVVLERTKVSQAARAFKQLKQPEAVSGYIEELRAALEVMHTRVAEVGAQKRAANRRAAVKRGVKPHAGFQQGDFVLVAFTEPDKLSVRWAGPMRVTRVIDEWAFELEDLVYGRKCVRHAQMMRPYADQHLDVTTELREQIAHDDLQSFRVQEILDWRQKDRQPVELLVRWLGFDDASDTWQQLDKLAKDVPVLVGEFVAAAEGRPVDLRKLRAAARRAGIE